MIMGGLMNKRLFYMIIFFLTIILLFVAFTGCFEKEPVSEKLKS